jgi:FKBP-type peptidyl-prolyl cis-trans isomerase FkpA
MKTATTAAALTLAVWTAAACKASGDSQATAGSAGTPQTEEQKTLYALGAMLGRNVATLNLTPDELAMVQKGLADTAGGRQPAVDLQTYGARVQDLARTRLTAGAKAQQEKGLAFQDAAAKEQGAARLPSGLVYTTLKPGSGPTPAVTDTVKVHYRGTLIDGTEFDSSIKRGQPAEFPLKGVIPCWTEGVQKMKVGEKAKLVCPAAIAYGERGSPPNIPGGATLVFEVELLEIKK